MIAIHCSLYPRTIVMIRLREEARLRAEQKEARLLAEREARLLALSKQDLQCQPDQRRSADGMIEHQEETDGIIHDASAADALLDRLRSILYNISPECLGETIDLFDMVCDSVKESELESKLLGAIIRVLLNKGRKPDFPFLKKHLIKHLDVDENDMKKLKQKFPNQFADDENDVDDASMDDTITATSMISISEPARDVRTDNGDPNVFDMQRSRQRTRQRTRLKKKKGLYAFE